MTTELDFFINSLHDEGIDTIKVLNDLNDFFDGDEIPIVFLLGSLGGEIYNSKLSFESLSNIFLLIEEAINSNNEQNISSLELMGEETRKYIKSYLEF